MRSSFIGFGCALGVSMGLATAGCGASPDAQASDVLETSRSALRGEENQGMQLVGDALGSTDYDGVRRVLPPPNILVQVQEGRLNIPSSPSGGLFMLGFKAELFAGGTVDLRIEDAVPASSPRKPPQCVARFHSIPRTTVPNSGAIKKLNNA